MGSLHGLIVGIIDGKGKHGKCKNTTAYNCLSSMS
jgi:hypothetical protein